MPFNVDENGNISNIVGLIKEGKYSLAMVEGGEITPFFYYFGPEKEFKNVCKKLEIELYEK